MSQLQPSQEIIAKDLHDHVWIFKHKPLKAAKFLYQNCLVVTTNLYLSINYQQALHKDIFLHLVRMSLQKKKV